jgi:hypothetical protein
MTRRHVAHRCKPPRDTLPASALPGNRPCGATLNSLISGVSRISRNRCKGSTGTLFRHRPELKCRPSAEVIHALKWGGRGSNPRPTDYESAALTN